MDTPTLDASTTDPAPSTDSALRTLLDRHAVAEVVTRIAVHADRREWELLRACFADRVHVDYTSLAGGEPAELDADALIASWKGLLPGFDATHHALANVLPTVTGDRAAVSAYVTADHVIRGAEGGERWTVQGRYAYRLERRQGRWLVTHTTLLLDHQRGNLDLAAQASDRLADA